MILPFSLTVNPPVGGSAEAGRLLTAPSARLEIVNREAPPEAGCRAGATFCGAAMTAPLFCTPLLVPFTAPCHPITRPNTSAATTTEIKSTAFTPCSESASHPSAAAGSCSDSSSTFNLSDTVDVEFVDGEPIGDDSTDSPSMRNGSGSDAGSSV